MNNDLLAGWNKIYVVNAPMNLRLNFSGLYRWVQKYLKKEPELGEAFVFINLRRDKLKIFFNDGTGLCICVKRLYKGGFSVPKNVSVYEILPLEHWKNFLNATRKWGTNTWIKD
jgi:transposase